MKKKLLPISLLAFFGIVIAGCTGPNSQASQQPSSVADTSETGTSESQSEQQSSQDQGTSSEEQPVDPTGVTLDQASANVVKGQTLQLNATVAPANANNKEITWSSDDEDVATVSKTGLVTAVEVGYAKITAKIKNTNLKAECDISVIKQLNSMSISNKSAFEGFIVDDSESLNFTFDPADNATALVTAGVLKVTSSDPTVAAISGLTVTALKAGTSTIKAELFGKEDSFELTVGEAIPGVKHTVLEALTKGITEAPWNGNTGKTGAITTTCFELTGKMVALASNGETGYNAILDDGTGAVYLQISRTAGDPIPFAVGDYAKVTCKFINYYGLLEGVSRKAATGDNASWIPSKDVEKIDAPATPITPTLSAPVAMTGEQYNAYYDVCKVNGTKNAEGATYTELKYVTLENIEFSEELKAADKGSYKINDKYGLSPIGDFQMDEPVDGQISTVDCFLIGANTGKSKSNAIVVAQTPLTPTAVVIDQEAQTIVHGNSLQLSYTTTPAGSYSRTVTWSSDAEANAKVDENGLVTGMYVGEGTKVANIKVKLADGVEATVAISVFGETVAATAASVEATASVFVGETVALTATTTPAMVSDLPVWTSSDETVATVDQKGVVKGVAEGTANIMVKYNDTVSATCAVTVSWEKGVRETDPLTVDDALALVADKANKYKTTKEYYIKGFVSEVVEDSLSGSYNNATFWLASSSKAQGFEGYRLKPVATCKNYDDFKVGAEILLKCIIYKYNASTVENDTGNIISISYSEHPTTALALDNESLDLFINGEATLKVTSTPFYGTSPVTWLSSDVTVATVNGGKVKGLKEGTATITAFVDANNDNQVSEGELKATCVVNVSVQPDLTLTAQSFLGYNKDNIAYPNEATDKEFGGITFTYFKLGAYGTGLQFQNNDNGWLKTKTETAKYITKIVIKTWSGKTDNAGLTVAKTVAGLASATELAKDANGVYTFEESAGIRAFQIKRNGGTAYVESINIFYGSEAQNEIEQPTGTFFASAEITDTGKVALGTTNSIVPIFITLGAENAVSVSINGTAVASTLKSYDKTNGNLVITTTAYGDISMTYNPENGRLEKLSVVAATGVLKYDAGQSLRGGNELKYWNFDGETSELQAQFNRRSGNSSWSLDSEEDRIVKNTEHAISGSALQLNKKSDNKERISLAVKDFSQKFNARNISLWVYNDGESSVNLQAFYYTQTNYGGYQQIFSGKACPAGQWTYISVGFTAADVYAFQFVVAQGTASTLIFDDICLF